MESEARNQINNDYNKFFYATMCHVCKRIGDGVPLKLCSNCKMISYCGQEHQKQHWKQHKPLCKAIQNVLQGRQGYNMNVRGETSEEWINIKQMFMLLVSRVLKRRLTMCEMQMFKFPRECLICHERNAQSLKGRLSYISRA
ncbi:SET and MYND domain-containing protein DDB_G0277331-like isoform X2 [Temnothorax curvispinosus]|uniref:SET and MYND domain-containing protein DDB_G0277331-like isoform X2 n=1 Tax=Temnothorax curvispinosus TaxID=300111 RepID=A0A6J1PFI7_9HYME|nr:SET and MYND domain-containing protein DDB_G0277331-like isoform X2 [Temnothorax curvispinosus]